MFMVQLIEQTVPESKQSFDNSCCCFVVFRDVRQTKCRLQKVFPLRLQYVQKALNRIKLPKAQYENINSEDLWMILCSDIQNMQIKKKKRILQSIKCDSFGNPIMNINGVDTKQTHWQENAQTLRPLDLQYS